MGQVTLRPGEKIRLKVHKHAIILAVPIIVAVLISALAFFLLSPLFSFGWIGVVIFFAMILLALFIGLRSWSLWRNTYFLVTNQRVIDVDRVGLFKWVVSDVTFDNLADISYETSGPVQTLCRSGNVLITSESGTNTLCALFVPQPGEVREIVVEEYQRWKRAGKGIETGQKDINTNHQGAEEELDLEDQRAVRRYSQHLKSRRAMRSFLESGGDEES